MNPLYLLLDEIDGFIKFNSVEEKKGSKCLNISLTDSNRKVLKKYADIWSEIKDQIRKINNGKLGEYRRGYIKIKLNSDDDLPLNKILKFRILTIIIRSIFEEDGKYYPQVFFR